jgi:four helix bundle protein
LATYNHFYELPVYKKCRAFRKVVFALVKDTFPKQEQYLLTAQTLDSIRSVTANIAEGFGRFHYQENIQFCRQSRGSLAETLEHFITAFDCGYIDHAALKKIHVYYKVCLKELNSYIKYLKAAKIKPIINNE